LIGSVGGYAVYAPLQRLIGGRRGILIGAMLAAWFSVLMAAGACALELSATASRRDFLQVLTWMFLVHSAIGLGEAMITGVVVRFVLLTRPDLIDAPDDPLVESAVSQQGRRWLPTVLTGLGIALAVAAFASPFASPEPDGLEFVGEKFGLLGDGSSVPAIPAPMPDYQLRLPGIESLKAATAAAGLVGTLVVFGLSWTLGRVFVGTSSGPQAERVSADAA
jgi:hypothetical protein